MKRDMMKLWSVRELSQQNKKKLYEALIKSKLTYPAIPTHSLSDTSLKKLQRVQNQGARFITNTRRLDRKRNEDLNREAQLQPINVILYERALRIWNKIRTTMRAELEGVYTYNARPKQNWPLSFPRVMEGPPPPIYG